MQKPIGDCLCFYDCCKHSKILGNRLVAFTVFENKFELCNSFGIRISAWYLPLILTFSLYLPCRPRNVLLETLGFPVTPTFPHRSFFLMCSSILRILAETLIFIFVCCTYHVLLDIQLFYPRALDQQSFLTSPINFLYLYQFLKFSDSLFFHSLHVSF